VLFISLASIFPESLEHFIDCEYLWGYEEEGHDEDHDGCHRCLHGEAGAGAAMVLSTLCSAIGIDLMIFTEFVTHSLEGLSQLKSLRRFAAMKSFMGPIKTLNYT